MMTIRGNTLKQNDGKDQLNHPNHWLRRKCAQRGEPVGRITLVTADLLRIMAVKLREARDDTHRSRAEGREDHTTKTTDPARGSGTRCQRARRLRQVRL